MSTSQPKKTSLSESEDSPLSGSPLLLIVEDDPDLALGLESYFSHVGYRVETVNQGNKALEAIRTTGPDAVLLDWRLPGKTGTEILREARDDGINTPAIMISVHSGRELRDKIRGPEPDDYVTKPFDLDDLKERVDALIE